MSWNYRVIEFVSPSLETWWAIHEVYYDDEGRPLQYSENPAPVSWGEDDADSAPVDIIDRMREALSKPVLTQFDFMSTLEENLGEVAAEMIEKEARG